MKIIKTISISVLTIAFGCNQQATTDTATATKPEAASPIQPLKPVAVTEPAAHDTDDPAIWVNPDDASKSLIIGTDKGGDAGDGALYVYDLEGNILEDKTIRGIKRPNNVDIAYGMQLGDRKVDIAVCTERYTNSLRVFALPSMEAIDNGGIEIFEGDSLKEPMGVALYTNPEDGEIYAIAGRKTGPANEYLWQYLLHDDGKGQVTGKLVRKFGAFSGKEEIEAIAVDNELGYAYYSDETHGIRKYYAHPDSSNVELALFGNAGEFTQDHEGISIYKMDNGQGYIIVSDQQANKFHIFSREGTADNPHHHQLLKSVDVSTTESDGSDVTSIALGDRFAHGLFVAMSDDKTFQIYRWEDIAGEDLKLMNTGELLKAQR